MASIQPIPATFPIIETEGTAKGTLTVYFKRWTDDVLNRILGITGGVYNRLAITNNTVLWDLNANPNAVITLTVPTTSITTLNQVAGAPPYRLTLIQDATGGRLVTWGGEFKYPSAVAPVLSVGANAVDELVFDSDGTNMRFQYGNKDLR